MSLDLTSEPNKQLLKLLTKDGSQQDADDIASQVYLLALKLKGSKITKSTKQKSTPASGPTQSTVVTTASPTVNMRLVKVDFYYTSVTTICYQGSSIHTSNYSSGEHFSLNVDKTTTVRQLTDQVIAKEANGPSNAFDLRLEFKGATMNGDLDKYNLKDGDRIEWFYKK